MKSKLAKSLLVSLAIVVMGILDATNDNRTRPPAGPSEERPQRRQRTGYEQPSIARPSHAEPELPPATITLITGDNQKISVPENIAFMSKTIELSARPPIPGALSLNEIKLRLINKQTLTRIVKALTQIQQLNTSPHGSYATPQVQTIVNKIIGTIKEDKIAHFINASNFLEIPYLVNTGISLYVRKLRKADPNLTLNSMKEKIRPFFPEELWLYFENNFIYPKGRRSIADYLAQFAIEKIEFKTTNVKFGLTLDLSGKSLRTLEGIAEIPGIENVKTIDLGRNKLTTIPSNAFPVLPKLKNLLLFSNDINSIEPNAFKGLINLEYLNINRNKIVTIEPNTFSGLNNLQELDLADNPIIQYRAKIDKLQSQLPPNVKISI